MRAVGWLVCGLMGLAACSATPAPVVIPAVVVASATLAPVSTETATPTSTSTATATATSTATATKTPQLTATPEPTATPSPAPISTQIFITTALQLIPTDQPNDWSYVLRSPDGQWVATSTIAMLPEAGLGDLGNSFYSSRLNVARTDGKAIFSVAYFTSPHGLGRPQTVPLMWSRDGKRLYFATEVVGDGCSLHTYRGDLSRYDVVTRKVTRLFRELGSDVTFSPDERWIAYAQSATNLQGEQESAVLRNWVTGQEHRFSFPNAAVQRFLFSPDSSKLLVMSTRAPFCEGMPVRDIVLIETNSLKRQSIQGVIQGFVWPVIWLDQSRILFIDEHKAPSMILDTITGKLMPVQ